MAIKISKLVQPDSVEVEVEITLEDIINAMVPSDPMACSEQNQRPKLLMRAVNDIATFLHAVPDSLIEDLSPGAREVIAGFLAEQVARFDPAVVAK